MPRTNARRIAALALLALGCPVPQAACTDLSIEGGRSYMGGNYSAENAASTVFVESVFLPHTIGRSEFTWSPDVIGGWMDGRRSSPREPYEYGTNDHIWLLGVGIRLNYGEEAAWYRPLFFSFQPALHTGKTQALSSSYEFASTLGWQARHWMIAVRHISNGDLHSPNKGETMLLVGITFPDL